MMKSSAESISNSIIEIESPMDTASDVAVGLLPGGSHLEFVPDAPPFADRARWSHGLEWSAVLWIMLVHVGALAAPFVFTWK